MIYSLLRLSGGLLLAAIFFAPFGVYHSVSEPYISGYLWGFNLPVGYVALLTGALVILYPRLTFSKKFSLGSFLMLMGFCLFLSLVFSSQDYFINLINSTSFGFNQIDVDFPIGNSIVWAVSIFSVTLGFVIRSKRPLRKERQKAPSNLKTLQQGKNMRTKTIQACGLRKG